MRLPPAGRTPPAGAGGGARRGGGHHRPRPPRWPLLVAALATAALGVARAAPAPLRIRAVTFNLLHGGLLSELTGNDGALEERLALAIEGLRALDADVIALQEASTGRRRGQVAARIAAALGYEYVYAPAAVRPFDSVRAQHAVSRLFGFTEGPAILSRFRLLATAAHAIPYCNRPFDTRVVLEVELETPLGALPVYSAHISGDLCMARAVAGLVQGRRSPLPALVMGDFNAEETAPAIRELTGLAGFVDAFRRAHPGDPGYTAGQDIVAPRPTASRRLDYVFVAPGRGAAARVLASRVVVNEPRPDGPVLWSSDHYAVEAELELDAASPQLARSAAATADGAAPR